MVIRSLTTEDLPELKKLHHYCFYDPDHWGWDSPLWDINWKLLDLNKCFGYFIDNKLVSSLIIRDYEFYVRGSLMKMGGVAGVATQPEFRQRGYVRELAQEALKCMREQSISISVLYPFKFSFYRRLGYEHCADVPSLCSTPRNIRLPANFKPLPIQELNPKEAFEVVQKVRREFGKKFNIIIFSSEEAWRFHYLRPTSRVFAIYAGEKLVGYFITELKKLAEWQVRLIVSDQLIGTEQARLTLFDYLKKHTDQLKDFKLYLSGDEKPLDYFIELWEEDIQYQISGGPMFRVVDIKAALQQLRFPPELTTEFTLKVTDPLAPWNEEPIKLQITAGNLAITKVKPEEEAEVQLDIKAFTQLFVGYRTVKDLLRLQKITIKDELRKPLLQAFPKRHTRLKTDF
ncbi:MAG: GNAT family N-acetyltransferase [Candidatus Heimdallarchaeota archaeon]